MDLDHRTTSATGLPSVPGNMREPAGPSEPLSPGLRVSALHGTSSKFWMRTDGKQRELAETSGLSDGGVILHQYRATLKSRWNEAELAHSVLFMASDGGTATQMALLLADALEVVVDTVPPT